MTGRTVVATSNVLCTLGQDDARAALRVVLDASPDLVGLQEWSLARNRLLRETGEVRMLGHARLKVRRREPGPADYLWVSPLVGGCPVGFRADRFELVACHSRILGWMGRSDLGARTVPVLPPRVATVAVLRDRERTEVVSLVNFHLTPGVQAKGEYRADRPLLVARHRSEVRNLDRLVAGELGLGRTVYAVGDSNLDGLRLTGLTSAWEGRESEPGTFGQRRKIDDVHGPGPADDVTLLASPSDHKAVVARRTHLA